MAKKKDFRKHIPSPEASWIAGDTIAVHTATRMKSDRAKELFGGWNAMYRQPYRGLTTDGKVAPGLYELRPEAAPVAAAAAAATALLARTTDDQKEAMCLEVNSRQWSNWQNSELYVESHGLRLDTVADELREGVMAVLQACMGAAGYAKARDVMRMNRFMGELIDAPAILGEWSYTFSLFGAPSTVDPWGWQIFGHHLCLNCLMIGDQMAVTPTFMGAEPTYADEGPLQGLSLFDDEERKGLALMQSLSPAQAEAAIVAHSMVGGDLPEGRRHFADNLNLGGAYQDNRIVPYEGLPCTELSTVQRTQLLDLIQDYLLPLPPGPLTARSADIERHLADTHFCWIGGTGPDNAFYYRIQSPVVFIEFDHHAGVFLANKAPMNFHVHTIVRTPNGNDYGMDLLRLHYRDAPHHQHRA